MKGKKLTAMIIALAMAASVSACGNGGGETNETGEIPGSETVLHNSAADEAVQESADAQSQAEGTKSPYNVTWEDMAEITVLYPSMGPIPNGLQAVEDAMNEITEQEINTHVTLQMIEVGNYDQQVSLILSSNEPLDLMITMPAGASSMATMLNQNQLTDMTAILEEYAPSALESVGNLIQGTRSDGKIVGFPAYKGFVSGEYINMRTDVLEDLGLLEKAENMKSFSEFEEILEAVKNSEKWSYLAGITETDGHGAVLPDFYKVAYSDRFEDCYFMEDLGNGVIVPDNSSDKVAEAYSTEAVHNNYEIVKRWYEKGYVYKDSATTQEMGTSIIKSNAAFSHIAEIEIGSESAQDVNCGMDMTSVLIMTKPVSTTSLTKFVWAMPTTVREPEAAATFLELMFNDARMANLFAWGIEGVDYEVDADGVAHYIEGNENPAYHTVAFLNPNCFIIHPWEGDDPDIKNIQKEYLDNAQYSKYLGFNADYSAVTSEISAISSVYTEFPPQINSGVASEETYQAFLDKLAASGMDTILEDYQKQLDAWLGTK